MVVDMAVEAPLRGVVMDETDERSEGAAPGPAGGMGRRRFLNRMWKLLGLGLAVEAAWTTYDILNPRASGAFGGVFPAGNVTAYPDGTVKYFQDGRMFVTSSEGSLVALYQKCPHLGCRVPFCDRSGRFECPCHGSIYNIRGEYIQGPAPRGMDRFGLQIQKGQVLVDTGTVVEGPPRGVRTVSSVAKGPSCVTGGGAATPQASRRMTGGSSS
jgi:cytochrome b6-f complex iron-sulfur subunit